MRKSNFEIKELSASQIKARLTTVCKTLYLLFNEGYYAKGRDELIRYDLCYEAIRLTVLLTDHKPTNTAEVNALVALMCYQNSRLDARLDEQGEPIDFEEQDQSRWNMELVNRGNYYLVQATAHQQTSNYHLEAAIAYWHTTQDQEAKWKPILDLYNQLILIEYSPITALNRTFAFAKVYGYAEGIQEAQKLNLTHLPSYFELLAYLSAPTNKADAITFYKEALALVHIANERKRILKKIKQLHQD